MGGYSSECAISLKSGQVAYQHIQGDAFRAFRVHILKDKWVVLDEDNEEYPVNRHDFSTVIKGEKITFDCVFNAIHGHPGENGVLLHYFELIGLKHSSAPAYEMGLTFNKRDCLSVLKQQGIKTADAYFLNKGDAVDLDKIIHTVGMPCFVKPNQAGSSFGISKVNHRDALLPAIEKAFKEDPEILIESFLEGTEVTVGVLRYQGAIKVLPITEIVSENDFFDYEAKYQGKSTEITPARISEELKKTLEQLAVKVYRLLNMRGFSRSEYIIVKGEPYFLEMNTVPGLTNESILPKQAAEAGIPLKELFYNAIETSLNTSLS